jgi:hypothetical protein
MNQPLIIDERTCHRIAKAFSNVKQGARYEYATLNAANLAAILRVPTPPDSYSSEDETTKAYRDLVSQGFRWIRTDGELAVFEKEAR